MDQSGSLTLGAVSSPSTTLRTGERYVGDGDMRAHGVLFRSHVYTRADAPYRDIFFSVAVTFSSAVANAASETIPRSVHREGDVTFLEAAANFSASLTLSHADGRAQPAATVLLAFINPPAARDEVDGAGDPKP